jgi:hypothetical protein
MRCIMRNKKNVVLERKDGTLIMMEYEKIRRSDKYAS